MFYAPPFAPPSFLGCVILNTGKLGHQRQARHKRKASTEALYRINTQRPVGLVAGDLSLCTVTVETAQTQHAKSCLEYQSFLVMGFVSSALENRKAKGAQAD